MKKLPLFNIRNVRVRTAKKFSKLAKKAKKTQADFLEELLSTV